MNSKAAKRKSHQSLLGENAPKDKSRKRSKLVYRRHPDLVRLMPSLGPVKEPVSDHEKIVESIDCEFMFDGFPGFELGALRVRDILKEHGMPADGRAGQGILKEYVQHCLEEYYGDFDRWTDCQQCSKPFKLDISLKGVNMVLNRRSLCPNCSVFAEQETMDTKSRKRPQRR